MASDLHEANLLLRMSDSIDDLTPSQLYEKCGQPELEQIKRLDGQSLDPWVPTHGVVPIWLGDASDTLPLADSRIFLSDFSESFRPAVDAPQYPHTPFILRSPELLLEPVSRSSFSAEIWSLACVVFAIMGQRPLFETWFPSKDRILEEHVDALGCFPKEWWTGWVNRNQSFDDQVRRLDATPRQLLADRFEASIQQPRRQSGMAEMNEEEKQHFLVLLTSMLAFRPEDRPSAQRVLESSWMRKWGKSAFELMEDQTKI
jgi:serine/threonine protein kinase